MVTVAARFRPLLPALTTKPLPGRVAIETTAILAQQIGLIDFDR